MSVKEDGSAKVRRIHVIGAENTRTDLLHLITSPLFDVKTVAQLLNSLNSVRQHLSNLGVFSHVRAVVDVAKKASGGSYDDPNYEVTLMVRERRRTSASIRTELETNGIAFRLGGRLLNATGRADQAVLEVIRGTNFSENGYAFGYSMPVNGDVSRQVTYGFGRSAFENCMPFLTPMSSYRQRETSAFFGHEFPLPYHLPLKYGFRLEHNWRRIEALQQITSFALRSLEGDSVKSSLRHFVSMDTRDSGTLPTSGLLARFTQEIALPPGDSRCIKHELELQYARSLHQFPLTIHASFNAGHILPFNNNPLALPDRYFIGGPLTLRGFSLRGVGYASTPSSNVAETGVIGGSCFWVGALHAYAPLPFLGRPTVSTNNVDLEEESNGQSGPNPIQLHGFLTAGDLAVSAPQLLQSFSRFPNKGESAIRFSAGAGVVMRLGSIARLELNYTLPLRAQPTDSSRAGFQFGIGVLFV